MNFQSYFTIVNMTGNKYGDSVKFSNVIKPGCARIQDALLQNAPLAYSAFATCIRDDLA